VIAALVARGVSAEQAACAGVHAHLRAGRRAGDAHGPDHVIASDVIRALPAALTP
ncbi:MAG: bifunctional ADP-dependent NAD(P)H-hydrate dehydratase/NAD(P)H-hydrate epimerase, partial [Solirubrobacterales bacterium]|nr:bifunctional ADP-dependent NAD(P)H-hydrate dehydratase/NAD(P)H-hydrate epimerase [Solirubrobacterales bacterium]